MLLLEKSALQVSDNAHTRRNCEGRISGIDKTIRIKSIHVHYDLAVPAESREATERALAAHPQGCPAHQSVKDATRITWSATLKAGDQVLSLREEGTDAPSA